METYAMRTPEEAREFQESFEQHRDQLARTLFGTTDKGWITRKLNLAKKERFPRYEFSAD